VIGHRLQVREVSLLCRLPCVHGVKWGRGGERKLEYLGECYSNDDRFQPPDWSRAGIAYTWISAKLHKSGGERSVNLRQHIRPFLRKNDKWGPVCVRDRRKGGTCAAKPETKEDKKDARRVMWWWHNHIRCWQQVWGTRPEFQWLEM